MTRRTMAPLLLGVAAGALAYGLVRTWQSDGSGGLKLLLLAITLGAATYVVLARVRGRRRSR